MWSFERMAWWWGIDKSRERETERMWVRRIERENTRERNEWTDLIVADNEWVEDRGDGAPSDRKEGHNRVAEEDIRVVEPKGKSSATSLVAFALPLNHTNNVSIFFLSYSWLCLLASCPRRCQRRGRSHRHLDSWRKTLGAKVHLPSGFGLS